MAFDQIQINSPSRRVDKELDEKLTKLGRSIVGGHAPSIAKSFAHEEIKEQILLKVMDFVNEVVDALCRKGDNPSPFHTIPVSQLQEFSFKVCESEMKYKCPFLYRLLLSLVQWNDHRNKAKRGDIHLPGLCLAMSIILKEHSRQMCGIQTYLSLILYNSRVQKKVTTIIICT